MKDHSNDPYIVKTADHAARMVAKYGLPAELVKLQAERFKGVDFSYPICCWKNVLY
jgi:hypothetical protein